MPATETTWRNQTLLNQLFAISGVVLTVFTVWMFYKDHARPWKRIQPNVVKIDEKYNLWRQEQFETTETEQEHARLMTAWNRATSQAVPADLLSEFKAEMVADAKYRETNVSFQTIDQTAEALEEAAASAAAARAKADTAAKAAEAAPNDENLAQAAREADATALGAEEQARELRTGKAGLTTAGGLITQLREVVEAAKIREEQALGARKFKSARLDAAKANLDIAIRDHLDEEVTTRQKIVNELTEGEGGLNELNLHYQKLSAYRIAIDKLLKQMTAEADAAQKALDDSQAALRRLETGYQEKRETWVTTGSTFPWVYPGKKILNLPILDAFGTRRKIDNLWAEGLEQDYNHAKVRRFDRCTTCHQSMVKTVPGEPTSPLLVTQRELELVVTPPAPEEMPKLPAAVTGDSGAKALEAVYGIRLADEGLLNRDDVTVKFVRAKSPAAKAQLAEEPGPTEVPASEIRQQVATVVEPPEEGTQSFPELPGLMLGDVITKINGDALFGTNRGAARVTSTLVSLATDGKPIRLTVRRGLPNPYASHPRLDLYLSDSSPHRMATFGCTVCHEGQGSATEFKWASHTPSTPLEARRWTDEYGWFENHHWIYPMNPKRFSESSCLKCHHEVVELEPSERFPDAPAPKLVHGYHLIRKYGCFGCHEIKGFDGPTRRVGPDMRLEPNFFAVGQILAAQLAEREQQLQTALAPLQEAAAPDRKLLAGRVAERTQLQADLQKLQASTAPDKDAQIEELNKKIADATAAESEITTRLGPSQQELSSRESDLASVSRLQDLAEQLAQNPEEDALRRRLRTAVEEDALKVGATEGGPLLSEQSHQIALLLKDIEAPGDLRKPGPSLRHVGYKLDRVFLYDWINNPRNFRPNTRMPRFFGLWDHFPTVEGKHYDEAAALMEPIEVRGMMEYLLTNTQAFDFEKRPEGTDESSAEDQVARGKVQFETRGCLACHTHKDFPRTAEYRNPVEIVQGPDLSSVGTKFSATEGNKNGPDWLYSWIKNPTKYHPRTLMPNVFLDVETNAEGKSFDPAGDITAYLLTSTDPEWRPVPESTRSLDAEGKAGLERLMLEHLGEAFYKEKAVEYYLTGIPPEMSGELKGAEKDLIVQPGEKLTDDQRLRYIGRKTIGKYGCYGCHDIPGFEDAKPIGTGLADWGRKDPSKLAFEHITHFLEHHGHSQNGHSQNIHDGNGHGKGAHKTPSLPVTGDAQAERGSSDQAHSQKALHDPPSEIVDVATAQDAEYYHHAIESGSRIGFVNQKLYLPRSYDFRKTDNKRFNERLRMPQFPFSAEDREAIVTFVLGLVADPPRETYVFQADERKQALIAGKQVLEKFNCGGCHILDTEQWNISYAPGDYGPQQKANVYPFLRPSVSTKDLQAAATPDSRNQLHATLKGLPTVMKNDALPYVADEDGVAIEGEEVYDPKKVAHAIDLFEPTILDGSPYLTGQSIVPVPVQRFESKYPTGGGMLTKYLLPRVTELERSVNPNASGAEALGWLPPPLVGEGSKVQTAWLHDFLLEPYPIRPATFLRMPKFNMSSAEAAQLVNYFAARDNADYPYEFSPARQESRQDELAAKYHARLMDMGLQPEPESRYNDALKIVVDNNYCVKCHRVADFEPQGSPRAKAPNLADVYRRLRPDYLRRWIANPKMILPYTSMPVNIPYDPLAPHEGGVKQELYHGTSTEQVDALVDLLMNFDQYARKNTQIADMVKPAETPAVPAAETTTGISTTRSAERTNGENAARN